MHREGKEANKKKQKKEENERNKKRVNKRETSAKRRDGSPSGRSEVLGRVKNQCEKVCGKNK